MEASNFSPEYEDASQESESLKVMKLLSRLHLLKKN